MPAYRTCPVCLFAWDRHIAADLLVQEGIMPANASSWGCCQPEGVSTWGALRMRFTGYMADIRHSIVPRASGWLLNGVCKPMVFNRQSLRCCNGFDKLTGPERSAGWCC